MALDVIVVGAGITGLSAAINIQTLIRRVNVTIIADSFGEDTTTPVSAGIFLPIPARIKGVPLTILDEWYKDSWQHHWERAKSKDGADSGQTMMCGYCFWSKSENYVKQDVVFNYKKLSAADMIDLNITYRHGCTFTTVLIDVPKYLPYLMKKFRERGGKIVVDTIHSLQKLYGKCDVVVNCTGKRCRELVADPEIIPMKGNVAEMSTAWAKNFFITDEMTLIPNLEKGISYVGYLWESNNHDATPDEDHISLMLNIAKSVAEPLIGSDRIKTWTEKRCSRTPPLIGVEMLNCGEHILPVVHNLGLGSETVSLAWGTGVAVAHHVQDIQRKIHAFSRNMQPFQHLI